MTLSLMAPETEPTLTLDLTQTEGLQRHLGGPPIYRGVTDSLRCGVPSSTSKVS